MDLRDYFAAHVAAALAHRMERPEGIASRAYDMADALVRERVRRPAAPSAWGDELPPEAFMDDDDARGYARSGLLDEPAPISEPRPYGRVVLPDPEVLAALGAQGARVLRTDVDDTGTAETTDDGKLKKSG